MTDEPEKFLETLTFFLNGNGNRRKVPVSITEPFDGRIIAADGALVLSESHGPDRLDCHGRHYGSSRG